MTTEYNVQKNYYAILGVSQRASPDELKTAHVKLGISIYLHNPRS